VDGQDRFLIFTFLNKLLMDKNNLNNLKLKQVNIKNLTSQCTANILLNKVYNRCLWFELNQRVVIVKIRNMFVSIQCGT